MIEFKVNTSVFPMEGEEYNIPANTIYYLESRDNSALDSYARENAKAIEEFINTERGDTRPMMFPFKFVYIARPHDKTSLKPILALRPDLKPDSDTAQPQADPAAPDDDFHTSVICRLLPMSAYEGKSIFRAADTRDIKPEDFRFFMQSFAYKVDNVNDQLLHNSPFRYDKPMTTAWLYSYYEPFEGITVINTEHDTPGISGLPGLSDEEQKEWDENERKLKERALMICKEIESLQRDNGLNFLHEQLADSTLRMLCDGFSSAQPSRLTIDDELRIFLPDYEMEINMNRALCKVFYILFLRHPEGIRLKEISDYKKELFDIYKNISNKTDLEKMEASIDTAINPEDTSAMFQYISLANKAFRDKLANTLADSYTITNERGKCSMIKLDRNLVTLPPFLKEKMK